MSVTCFFNSVCVQWWQWPSVRFRQSLFHFALSKNILSQGVLCFFYQSLSVCNVTLPPPGPVLLLPLCLGLGVLQYSLPPQALLGLDAQLRLAPLSLSAAGFVGRRQQRWRFLVGFFAPPATASEAFLLRCISELGKQQILRGKQGYWWGLRRQLCLCRETI